MSINPHLLLIRHENFVKLAKQVHGDKFDYSKIKFKNHHTKVEIICKYHGGFFQKPNGHTSGKQGCPTCEQELKPKRNKVNYGMTLDEFITRANILYKNKFNYESSEYLGSNKPITIQCPDHGLFTVARAEKHLIGQLCRSCGNRGSSFERIIENWLTIKKIKFTREHTFVNCISPFTNRLLRFDFYLPNINMLIEYDGEQHFKETPLFHQGSRFFKLQQHDIIKTNYAKDNNIVLLRISYKEKHKIDKILSTTLTTK